MVIKLFILLIMFFLFLFLYKKNLLLSSASIWLLCYSLIFIVYPIYSDVNFINAGKIDILALLGVIFFSIGIILGNKFKIKQNKISKNQEKNKVNMVVPKFRLSLIVFIIIFIISVYVILNVLGMNGVANILRGSMTSKQFSLGDEKSTYLSFAMHLMVPCILSMWISSKTRFQKIVSILSFLVYSVETILFGFTRIFFVSIIVIIFLYEMRFVSRKKQIIYGLVAVLSMILLMVFMNFVRNLGVSNANNFRNSLDINYLFESTDFGFSYYYFDDLLKFESPHINPIVYLKPIFALIPRSVWPDKPEPLSMQLLRYTRPWLLASGYSTAGNSILGEGYAIGGYLGVVIYCFIWGIVCIKLDLGYRKRIDAGNDKCIQNVYYYIFAVFVIICAQRGDWSQYMTIVLWFYFLPIYFLSKFTIRKDGKYGY